MPDQGPKAPQPIDGALLASGFPFQTAVAQILQHTPGCTLIEEEFPWQDDTGADQFLDIVGQKGFYVMTIECKKTRKETLVFLQPEVASGDEIRARCIYLTQVKDATRRIELRHGDTQLRPKSPESAFCVVSTSPSGKDQRMLERDAQRVVRGTDAYAQHYKQAFRPKDFPEPSRFFLPIIVTNAKLFVAEYNTADVSLETGELSKNPPATISPIKWVRFRKAFITGDRDMGYRTVLIVAATQLKTFLEKLEEIS